MTNVTKITKEDFFHKSVETKEQKAIFEFLEYLNDTIALQFSINSNPSHPPEFYINPNLPEYSARIYMETLGFEHRYSKSFKYDGYIEFTKDQMGVWLHFSGVNFSFKHEAYEKWIDIALNNKLNVGGIKRED